MLSNLSNLKAWLIAAVSGAFAILLGILKLKSARVESLKKDLKTEQANKDKLETVIAKQEQSAEMVGKSNEIRETNATSDADDIHDRLSKYQRD